MPIYEYECKECEHTFDILQKISDPNPTECPECKKDALKRLISSGSFILNGQGFYRSSSGLQ